MRLSTVIAVGSGLVWSSACLMSANPRAALGAETGRYRFEEGMPGSVATTVLDSSIPGGNNGTAFGTPLYTSDVPTSVIPLTGEPNLRSLEFDHFKRDFVRVNSLFPFHDPGDMTLEFWLRVPTQGHAAIFWSRVGSLPDRNYFQIYLGGGGDIGPFAPQVLGMVYREPSGLLHQLLGGAPTDPSQQAFILNPGEWTHVGIVRTGNTYEFYKNGNHVWQTIDVSPNLPTSVGWEIAGRTHDFSGQIDEIRFSNRALLPSEFLIAVPEPSASLLTGIGLGYVGLLRRRHQFANYNHNCVNI